MTYWRWVRRDGRAGWVEADNSGNPLPGAKLRDRVPTLQDGDRMSADDVARQTRQLGAGQNQPTVAERVERTKQAMTDTTTIRTGDSRQRERQSVSFEDRLAATKRALAGKA